MNLSFDPQFPFSNFIIHSETMRNAVKNAQRFAMFDAPLLIQGETGTGKDLLAKSCHYHSLRRDKKFIAVNCAGLPANEGTVLLDGIAELSLNLQAKLLRFLTDGSFRRVGEEREHYANVRVICTSQVPLDELVKQGKVRTDLYHRLNVLTINVPPLRERIEDIQPLMEIFLQEISEMLKIDIPTFDQNVLVYLQKYNWQGNVRELYNTLYRACSLVQNNHLTVESLNLKLSQNVAISLDEFENKTLDEIMGAYEAQVLCVFYAKYPSTRKLAQRLGISHTAIANKLKLYGITK